MAARIIEDEGRPEDDNVLQEETFAEVEDLGAEKPTHEATAEQTTDEEVPDKYRGKSMAELVRMHQEAEKLVGRQSGEVGELRKIVDSYIQTQTSPKNAPTPQDEEFDFFDDPERAVARAIENHPKLKEAEAVTREYAKQASLNKLKTKHPDMNNILQDEQFAKWIEASKIRTQLFIQADQQYDFDAADELLTLWKDRVGTVKQAEAMEKQSRKATAKSASTGGTRGNPDSAPRKIYRRADIIRLMQTDPERYEALSPEIMRAYAEGRVK